MCAVLFVTLGTLGGTTGAGAATVTWPVSSGADGALSLPAGNYTFDTVTGQISNGSTVFLAAFASGDNHAWNFTTLSVASGANISFAGSNLPDILVSGDASIGGAINLDGSAAPPGGGLPAFAGSAGGGVRGGAGGAHGQGGGGGGNGTLNACAGGGGGGGNGGGGGGGAKASSSCAGGNGGTGGGLGGLAGPNGGGGSDPGTYAGQAGAGAAVAGGGGGGSIGSAQNDLAVTNNTLYPGSGGGGGGTPATSGAAPGGAGGGGGGAIQVVAGGTMTVSGTIVANGAGGGSGFAGGGGGSGGLIELAAPAVTLTSSAIITARGGVGGTATSTSGGAGGQGGLGRIRIAADQLTNNGAGLNPAIGTGNGAGLAYVSRWSSAVLFTTSPPSVQTGDKTGPMSVVLEGNDGNPVPAPAGGMQLTLSSTSSTGTFYDSTGSTVVTSVTVPSGSSTASFQYSDTSPGAPTVTVTPPGGSGLAAATQQVTVTAPPLSVTTTTLKTATVGVAYHVQLHAEGAVPPYSWSVSSGALPSGVSLSKKGVLSGTPTESGQFPFDVSVRDAETTPAGASLTLTVIPIAPDGSGTLRLTPRTASVGSVGNTLTFTYHAPSTGALVNGAVQITVPSGWSQPSTVATDPGSVTASKGSVSVAGLTVTISVVSLSPGAALKIVYGAKGGGGPGATAPSAAGTKHFLAAEQSTATGTMTSLAKSPSVKVS